MVIESTAVRAWGTASERAFLVLSCTTLSVGTCGTPLLLRLYFLRGGSRVWLSSWIQTVGFPIFLLPLAALYFRRRPSSGAAEVFTLKPRLFLGSAAIGVLTGLDNYFYAFGVSRLPVSTSSLIIATQLAFTAAFAFLLVKQRFTPYSVNSIFLLTAGAAVLGLHTGSDRPAKETKAAYLAGFFMTLGAALLYGFILPAVEFTYKKGKQAISFATVVEFQTVMSVFATAFCTVGMLVNHDFQAIPREAKKFELGEGRYYMVLLGTALLSQCFFMGAVATIYSASSLFSGIVISVLLPATEVLAVIFFHEKFQSEKGVALALSLWGFASYFYGEFKQSSRRQRPQQQKDATPPQTEAEMLSHSSKV